MMCRAIASRPEHRVRRRALSRHPAHDVGRPVALAEDHRRGDARPVAGGDEPGAPAAWTCQRVRIDPTLVGPPIELDDYRRAMDELLPAVLASGAAHRDRVEEIFLKIKAERFVPVPWTE